MLSKPLGEIADIYISNVDKKSKDNERAVKLCNFTDIYNNWAISSVHYDEFMVASANDAAIAKFTLHKGDVAITKDSETRDDIGVSAYIAEEMESVVLGYHCALIRPKTNIILGSYLNVVLHSPYAQKYFEVNASGSGQRYTLTDSIIRSMPIPVPDIEEQRKIGSFISLLDRKIENDNLLMKELELIAQKLYDYWFIQFDYPDENGDPYKKSGGKMVWNKELKRDIPEGKIVKKVSEIIEVKDGTHESPKYIPEGKYLITSKHLTDNGIDFASANHITDEDYDSINIRSKVDKGDILFSMIGAVGTVYRVDEDEINFAIKNVALYKSSQDECFIPYLYMTLKSQLMTAYITNAMAGSIQKFMSLGALRNMPILYDEKMVLCYYKSTKDIFERMTNVKKEIQELNKLRNFVLPLLVTGQVIL